MYLALIVIFVLGYLAIALEHTIKVDKTASALLLGVVLWMMLALGGSSVDYLSHELLILNTSLSDFLSTELGHHVNEIAQILFFLMGAMTIVELIDAHGGFQAITRLIKTQNAVALLWIICIITFFTSAILDNLTTTIVMITLLRKLVHEQRQRWLIVGFIVIAANAGGAWSPMGDITTTMLWIGHQVTAKEVVFKLIIPSLICLLVPLVVGSWIIAKNPPKVQQPTPESSSLRVSNGESLFVFALGVGSLLFVPIFKAVTHLPPFLGIMFGLGLLWVVTEWMHRNKDINSKQGLTVTSVISKIDTPSILFFLGILLAVSALASSGHLLDAATALKDRIGNVYGVGLAIGLLSAIVDNVPLVAGSMNMYEVVTPGQLAAASHANAQWLQHFVTDGTFWEFLAYCAGTGGSCLIIGSAAGVVAMGMEKIDFMWYLKHISLLALAGYFAGAAFYIFVSHSF